MKLATTEEDVTVHGEVETGQFRIKESAKAFQILSSGLYSDKILAIVRELSCNAWDSHVENGNADEPFEVQFPNALTPEFRIQDFGIGLDHDGVMNVYTTYFESTKQDSNDYIGALGLGSKSPFSYTKNFSIVAIKDGVQRTYAAMIDKHGMPNIVLLDTTDTTERNGVEVKFPVDRSDFSKFKDAGRKVYKWFSLSPTIKGNKFEVQKQEMVHVAIIPGVDIRNESGWDKSGPLARQGNVVYPLKPNTSDVDSDLRDMLEVDFVIDFPIGSLDVAASREELSYIEHTNVNINARLREIQNGLIDYVTNELKKAKSDWDKVLAIHKLRSGTFTPVLRAVLKNSKNLFDTIDVGDGDYGTPNVHLHEVTNWEIAEYSTKHRNRKTGEVRLKRHDKAVTYGPKDKDGNKTVVGRHYKVHAPNALFFLNDTGKKNCLGRVRLYLKDNRTDIQGKSIYVVQADTAKALAAFKKSTGGAPHIACSGLTDPPRYSTSATATTKITLLKLTKSGTSSGYRRDDQWSWNETTQSLVDAADGKTTYYVPLKNRTVLHSGQEYDKHGFFDFMSACHNAGLVDGKVVVYGVRKSVIKQLTSDYVNFFEAMKTKVAAVSGQKIAENVKRSSVAKASMFNDKELTYMKDQLGDKHGIAIVADAAVGADKIKGIERPSNTHYVGNIASRLDVKLDVYEIKDKAEKEGVAIWDKLVSDYPMLTFINHQNRDCTNQVIIYMKLVDEAA